MKRRFVTPEMVEQMKALEADGFTRKDIAERLDIDPATVTKHLGAVRQYRGLRFPQPA